MAIGNCINFPTSPTGGAIGTTTNDNASSGEVGEIISSTVLVGSAVSLSSGATSNITSISCTAGDWDVWGVIATDAGVLTTTSNIQGAVSTTSATLPTRPNSGAYVDTPFTIGAGGSAVLPVGQIRMSIAETTTIYLVMNAVFALSTLDGYGYICARRVR